MSTATANGNSTAIQKQPEIIGILSGESFKRQLGLALPRHMTPDRFARIALTAMRKTPKLQNCTLESLLSCLMSLSQYGLEPDGRRAHLIPYENRKAGTVECTLILDYKGLAELALRSGLVSTLHADVVQDGDVFEYSMGVISNHVPWFLRRDKEKPESAGDVYAVYAMCTNKDGTAKCEVLSLAEINGIMRRSKSSGSGPWQTDWSEMAKKTAFRRLSKWLVLSPEFRDAVNEDEDRDIIETTATRIDHTPMKIADLVGDEPDDEGAGSQVSRNETNTETVSSFAKCAEWLAIQPATKLKESDAESGSKIFSIGDSMLITIADGCKLSSADGHAAVDTFDTDAMKQVQAIHEKASTKRS